MLALLKTGVDVRENKVSRVRAAVERCSYENELKILVAVERLLADIGGGVDDVNGHDDPIGSDRRRIR